MKQPVHFLTRTAILAFAMVAAAIVAAPVAAQQPVEDDPELPLDSLVLVLNLISSTHARPATGVVLAAQARPGHVLVLVPASFVQAGDEIIVLDGGNDILGNGRSTRTVARSASAGVAVLEVEGLVRPGVTLATDSWPNPLSGAYTFAAWPDAGALAEGAALTRQTVSPDGSLPSLSGPLFDPCGFLAAMHLHGEESRTTAGPELAEFLGAFEIEHQQSACMEGLPDNEPESETQVSEEAPEGVNVSNPVIDPTDSMAESPPSERVSDLGLTPAQRYGLLMAWLVLGTLAFMLYVRRQKRRSLAPVDLVFERLAETGQRFHHTIKLDPAGKAGQFQRNGLVLNIQVTEGGFELSVPEDENPQRTDLVIGGTPCLGGEKFLVTQGEEIQFGNENFLLLVDS